MPELPEVEVVRLFLDRYLLNRTIIDIDVITSKSFPDDPSLVIGQKITQFSRHGKQLSAHLSNGLILLFHLKMTGQLIVNGHMLGHPTANTPENFPNKSTRVIFYFSSPSPKGVLYFNDQRKFGWIRIYNPSTLRQLQQSLGPDIFDSSFTPDYFYSQLHGSSRPVKSLLLDQHRFAGIGNIYANDALFLAKIYPLTPANQVTRSQSDLLHRHLLDIMRQSVKAGGSTAKDKTYLRPDGTLGANQFSFRVYQRHGQSCLVCGTTVVRVSLSGRGTFYCPHCQPSS